MANNETLISIPGRLHSVATEGHVAGADEIYDDNKSKIQSVINADVDTAIGSDSTEGSIKGRIKSLETLVGSDSVSTQINNKIDELDATKTQGAGSDGLGLSITEVDGKITSISGSIEPGTYATLENGKVPSSQLPSYVDDVINGYYYNGSFYKEAAHTTVITGEEGKIYVDIPTNKSYRWSGSVYILISNPYSVDEEDLTVSNNNIKFKDRPNTDGMGRIILRKNMVSGVNTLTQSMMQATNTIYVIQYDFTLGEDITVPANCVLEFDGGSISGAYTLTGNNTGIQAGLVKIFNTDVTLDGTWNISEAYPEWFGAKGDGVTDDTIALNCIVSFFASIKCNNQYLVHDVIITHDIVIVNGRFIAKKSSGNASLRLFYCNGNYNISFKNVIFDGNAFANVTNDTVLENLCRFEGCKNVSFDNCEICNYASDLDDALYETEIAKRSCFAILVLNTSYVLFEKCYIHNNRNEQICIASEFEDTELLINECRSDDNSDSLALYILLNLKKAVVTRCSFKDNGTSFFNVMSSYVTIQNCILDGSRERGIGMESGLSVDGVNIYEGILYPAHDITIIDNVIQNCSRNAIDTCTRNVKISGNIIQSCNGIKVINHSYYNGAVKSEIVSLMPFLSDSKYSYNEIVGNIIISDNILKDIDNSVITINDDRNYPIGGGNPLSISQLLNTIIANNKIIDVKKSTKFVYFTYGTHEYITIDNNYIEYNLDSGNANTRGIINSRETNVITLKKIKFINNHIKSTEGRKPYCFLCFRHYDTVIDGILLSNNYSNVSASKYCILGMVSNLVLDNNTLIGDETRIIYDSLIYGYYIENGVIIIPNDSPKKSCQVIRGQKISLNNMIYNVLSDGTYGELTNVTASGESGSSILTLNDASDIHAGDTIIINTRTYTVVCVNGNNVTIRGTLSETITNASVSYKEPLLIGIQYDSAYQIKPSGLTTKDVGISVLYNDGNTTKPIWWNGTAWVDATGTPV